MEKSVAKILAETGENPSVALDAAPRILEKFQYFFGNADTLKWFQDNLHQDDNNNAATAARYAAVQNAEQIKSSLNEQLSYLIRENFIYEAVRLVKTNNPQATLTDILGLINLPNINLPDYNHENYTAMLCSYWNVKEESTVTLTWKDFPSNAADDDSNVYVPYSITINTYFLYEAKILLESLAAWYGQNFNTLPFTEFICRLNWFICNTIHEFRHEIAQNPKTYKPVSEITKHLAELVHLALKSPESTFKDIVISVALLIDENRDDEKFELHLDLSLIDFYRKILDSHVSICPTVYVIFIITRLFMCGNLVMEGVEADKAISTLCVWAARKAWKRSATFNERQHNIWEFFRLKKFLPVFIKDRFSLSRLLSIPASDLLNRFQKMESMFNHIPLYILVNYIPWIFINNNAFTYSNVPIEYLPLAAFIHVRDALNKVNEANTNAAGKQYLEPFTKTNGHAIVQVLIKVLSITNLVEPVELLELANTLI